MNDNEDGNSATSITYYDVLGVPHNATQKDIRRAYLKLSLQHHPDKNSFEDQESAKARFVAVGEAYEVLSDPVERKRYDRELLLNRQRQQRRQYQQQQQQQQQSQGQQQQQSRPNDGGYYSEQGASAGNNNNYSSSSRPPQQQQQQQQQHRGDYDYYGAKFDSFVAGLSEEELRAAEGLASVVGSLVGSALGSRLAGGRNAPLARSVLGTAGSLVGSMVGSRAGVSAVRTVHEQSLDRLAYEEQRREAVERGEEVPRPQPSPSRLWDNLRKNILDSVVENVASRASSGQQQQEGSSSSSSQQQQQRQHRSTTTTPPGGGGFSINFKIG